MTTSSPPTRGLQKIRRACNAATACRQTANRASIQNQAPNPSFRWHSCQEMPPNHLHESTLLRSDPSHTRPPRTPGRQTPTQTISAPHASPPLLPRNLPSEPLLPQQQVRSQVPQIFESLTNRHSGQTLKDKISSFSASPTVGNYDGMVTAWGQTLKEKISSFSQRQLDDLQPVGQFPSTLQMSPAKRRAHAFPNRLRPTPSPGRVT